MEQNDRKNSREWAEILLDWQESGETQREYCRGKSIRFSTLNYWRNKLRNDCRSNLMVKVGSAALPTVTVRNTPTVQAGEIEVKLSGHESEELLARIFKALKASL